MSVLRFGTLLLAALIIALGVYLLTSAGGDDTDESSYVGTYRSRQLPAASSPGRMVALVVQDGGNATMTTDFQNNEPPVVQTGTWTTDGGILVVTLRTTGARPLDGPVIVSFLSEGDLIRTTGAESERMFGS
jgi:hypothetical protein